MPRYTYVYPADGRPPILKGSPEHEAYLGERTAGPMVFADEGDFVSPIDGKVYSGKRGMHEHNRRHDVVNNRDLKGLPTGINSNGTGLAPKTNRERQEMRQTIVDVARSRGYLEGQ